MPLEVKISDIHVTISGEVLSIPLCVSTYGKVHVYETIVGVKRLSGVVDEILVNFSSELGLSLEMGTFISVKGDLRSINKKDSAKPVKCFVYAKSIELLDAKPETCSNSVDLSKAYIQEVLEVRKSYSDTTDIAIYNIKLIRPHSRYSYFRCTSWGKDAVFIGNIVKSGMEVEIKARLQSHRASNGKLFVYLAVYYIELLSKK